MNEGDATGPFLTYLIEAQKEENESPNILDMTV